MSTPYETPGSPPPEPPGSGEQVHEHVVKRVRDLDDKIVLSSGGGSDTGWRQVFPLTYDVPLDHPVPVRTAEDGPDED
jgi:hypothetical protein